MENPTSFDLNLTIQRWRECLATRGTMSGDQLEEMETHLRDSMATLQARGLSAGEAFLLAARRLGQPASLAEEFAVVNPGVVWRQRALWMLAGMLFWTVGKGAISIVHSGAIYAGSWFTKDGFLLGWLGGGLQLLSFAAVMVAFWLLANGRFAGSNNLGGQLRKHPARFIGGVVLGMLFLNLASGGLTSLTLLRLDPTMIGQSYIVGAWFSVAIPLFQMAAMIGGIVWLSRRRSGIASRSSLASWLLIASVVTGLSLAPVGAQDHGNTNRIATPKSSPATLDEAMKLWREGRQSEAVEKFLAVDFSQRPLFPTGSVLNFTEAQFIALPQTARDKMSKAMLDDIQTLKLIAGRVKETAKAPTKATLCSAQLKAAGEAFDRPDGLALLKLVGKALKKMAAPPAQ